MVKTYDPKQVIVNFFGIDIKGFADGTFVTITKPENNFSKTVGADGTVSRSKSNDTTYEVTLELQQTSDSNNVLSGFSVADKLGNAGIGPLFIKDGNGTSLFFAASAWVQKDPDAPFSKEIENRTWVFDTGEADNFIGGNS